jgi:hypothetical protein
MRTKKTLRLRGSKSYGRGWRKSRHKGGSRGGTGRAGTKTHKVMARILQEKKRIRNLKAINLRDLEPRLDRYIRKKYLVLTNRTQKLYRITSKFYTKFRKVIGEGQLSVKLQKSPYVRFSKTVKTKML